VARAHTSHAPEELPEQQAVAHPRQQQQQQQQQEQQQQVDQPQKQKQQLEQRQRPPSPSARRVLRMATTLPYSSVVPGEVAVGRGRFNRYLTSTSLAGDWAVVSSNGLRSEADPRRPGRFGVIALSRPCGLPPQWAAALDQGPVDGIGTWLLDEGVQLDCPLLLSVAGRWWVAYLVASCFYELWQADDAHDAFSGPSGPAAAATSAAGEPVSSSSLRAAAVFVSGTVRSLYADKVHPRQPMQQQQQQQQQPAAQLPTGPTPARPQSAAGGGWQ
jgi:hypothetical protein